MEAVTVGPEQLSDHGNFVLTHATDEWSAREWFERRAYEAETRFANVRRETVTWRLTAIADARKPRKTTSTPPPTCTRLTSTSRCASRWSLYPPHAGQRRHSASRPALFGIPS
ncbi:hypothetical protein [Streptomyces massasporeus]|uniref:hypothetical protein n=1 Tax=Streptomyces massasporeus TaxID=67324 RepID=UPI0037035A43